MLVKDILLDILENKEENSHDLLAQIKPLLNVCYIIFFFIVLSCVFTVGHNLYK